MIDKDTRADTGPKFPIGSRVTLNDPTYVHDVFEIVEVERHTWSGFVDWFYTIRNLEFKTIETAFEEDLKFRYTVGETVGEGTPCVLEDGDSVLCIFPQVPESVAMDRARQVANILNGLEGLPQ